MIYTPGDILKVFPLQDVTNDFKSNVHEPYLVVVVSDDKDFLVTKPHGFDGHVRTFDKNSIEWNRAHKYRFKKLAN